MLFGIVITFSSGVHYTVRLVFERLEKAEAWRDNYLTPDFINDGVTAEIVKLSLIK